MYACISSMHALVPCLRELMVEQGAGAILVMVLLSLPTDVRNCEGGQRAHMLSMKARACRGAFPELA